MLIFPTFPGLFAVLEWKLATALCFLCSVSRYLVVKRCSRWSRKGKAPLLFHFPWKLQLLSSFCVLPPLTMSLGLCIFSAESLTAVLYRPVQWSGRELQ